MFTHSDVRRPAGPTEVDTEPGQEQSHTPSIVSEHWDQIPARVELKPQRKPNCILALYSHTDTQCHTRQLSLVANVFAATVTILATHEERQ